MIDIIVLPALLSFAVKYDGLADASTPTLCRNIENSRSHIRLMATIKAEQRTPSTPLTASL
jgi:hypothetical protein